MSDSYPEFHELSVDGEKALRRSLEDRELILIDGRPVDDEPMRAAEGPVQGRAHELEIHLGAVTLWHELQEAEQQVSNRQLLSFVRADLEAHPRLALEAYLEIAQRSRRKPPSAWQALTGRRRRVRYIWECDVLRAESRTSDLIIFKGDCYRSR